MSDDRNTPEERAKRALQFIEKNSLPLEEWRVIENTDNKYYVSSRGRVLSAVLKNPFLRRLETDKDGYSRVQLCKNGDKKGKHYRIHNLMAEAFQIEKPEGKVEVHHKDFTTRNDISNLEYLTVSEHHRKHKEYEERKKAEDRQKHEGKQE